MTVLLLLSELLHDLSQQSPSISAAAARRRLQSLMDWIDSNPTCPLPLSDLEAQAQMSRRNLQYTFQRAYDFSPMQWISRRRLELAMERLKELDQNEMAQTIGSVAMLAWGMFLLTKGAFSRHLARQWTSLIGTPPGVFQASQTFVSL
ncbi:MAG: AraC family transcriptional regulator [Acidobacteria bacterium]|nr:AraC family transcriptional regulator [Acidobacteriota bacterium]